VTNSITFFEISVLKLEKSLPHKDFLSSATLAWEAVVLPIYESCADRGIIAEGNGNSNPFLSKLFLVAEGRLCYTEKKRRDGYGI
jgi:hypothetical protein